MKKFQFVKGRLRDHFTQYIGGKVPETLMQFVVMGGYDDENGKTEFEELLGVKNNLIEAIGIGFDYISSCMTDFIDYDKLKDDFESKITPIAQMDDTEGYVIYFSLSKKENIDHWVKIYVDKGFYPNYAFPNIPMDK